MNELIDRVTVRLEHLADTAEARRDVDAVMAGTARTRSEPATNRRPGRFVVQIAAGAIALAGVGAIITFAALRDSPATQAPVEAEPAPAALPAAPSSPEAARLMAECLAAAGLDARGAATSIISEEQAASEAEMEAAKVAARRICEERLVADGRLLPRPNGPDPATTSPTSATDVATVPRPSTETVPPATPVPVSPFDTAAEAARDVIVAMLVDDGWTEIGGDHDVAGSATFGVENANGTIVTGHVLLGATEPVGDRPVTATITVAGHELLVLGEHAAFAACGDVAITVDAPTIDESSKVLTAALDRLEC